MKRVIPLAVIILLCFMLIISCIKQQEEPDTEITKEEESVKTAVQEQKEQVAPVPEVKEEPETVEPPQTWIKPEEFSISVPGTVYFVSPDGLDTNAGTAGAPWSLDKANDSVKPGDAVILMDGTYNTSIDPQRSGEKGKSILYKGLNPAHHVFTNIKKKPGGDSRHAAIRLLGRSYITIDGVTVKDVYRFIASFECHHITINACTFENASGWQACSFKQTGDRITFRDNSIKQGTDLISIAFGNNHLIEGNTFGPASHTGLALLGVQRSVVRNNFFTNPLWKCMEVFSTRKSPERLSMYNLIEANRFDYSPSSGIQYAGNRSILRRNIFKMCRAGMNWANYKGKANYAPEARHNYGNRFYNNVIVECGPSEKNTAEIKKREKEGTKPAEPMDKGGTSMAGMTFTTNMPSYAYYYDQKIVNNIFFRNHTRTGDEPAESVQIVFDWDANPTSKLTRGLPNEVQTILKPPARIPYYGNEHGSDYYPSRQLCYLLNNNILCEEPGQKVFWWCDAKLQKPPLEQNFTLKEFEEHFPSVASGNIEADPLFADIEGGDFRLKEKSPCIDAGRHLTRTITYQHSSMVINVGDATWFTDGYGIVEPDVIRVGDERVKIVKVDYDNDEITVERPLAWGNWAPVNLDYKGRGPDMGAYEFDGPLSAAQEGLSLQKPVLKEFTFENGVTVYFPKGIVSSEKAYSGTYSLRAEKAPEGKQYDSEIESRWIKGGVCDIPEEQAYINFAYYAPVDGKMSIGVEGSTDKNRKYVEFLAKKEIDIKKEQWTFVSLPIKEFDKGSEVLGKSWSWFYIRFKNGKGSIFYVDDISLVDKGEPKPRERGASITKQWDFEKGDKKYFATGTLTQEKAWRGSSSLKAASTPKGKWYQCGIETQWSREGICVIPKENVYVNFAYYATMPCNLVIGIEAMPGETTAKKEIKAKPGSWQIASIPLKEFNKGNEVAGKKMSWFYIRVCDTEDSCEFYFDNFSVSEGAVSLYE